MATMGRHTLTGDLEIRFRRTTCRRRRCFFCGKTTSKSSFVAEMFADAATTGLVICVDGSEACINRDPNELARRLTVRAHAMRREAETLAGAAELFRKTVSAESFAAVTAAYHAIDMWSEPINDSRPF